MRELGMIGLGRMGGNMAKRILRAEGDRIRIVGANRNPEPLREIESLGGAAADSVPELIEMLGESPRVIWLMLPAGKVTEHVLLEALDHLDQGDIVIDGANSNFHDTARRAGLADERGVRLVGCGVSGGVVAAERGYALMAGGVTQAIEHCRPIFERLACEGGFGHVGERPEAGHYVKMVHNAIEYGMMQAIAEGFDLLESGSMAGDFDLAQIAELWNHGTIISSFLMEMVTSALSRDPRMEKIAAHVDDSGEGRWAAFEAMESAVPFTANTYALQARHTSRHENSMAFRLLAAMRQEFGGHAIQEAKG